MDPSHELRTPLTVIKGELEELTRESHPTESDLRERIGSVLEEVARLEHLVSGLLVLSRLDAGEKQGDWVDVDLAEPALNTAEHMQLMAEDRDVEIDLAELRKTVIQGDRARLKQIIVNLLDNAIRFTRRGGTASLRTAADETEASLRSRIPVWASRPARSPTCSTDSFALMKHARAKMAARGWALRL